jgi:hypothetical protein
LAEQEAVALEGEGLAGVGVVDGVEVVEVELVGGDGAVAVAFAGEVAVVLLGEGHEELALAVAEEALGGAHADAVVGGGDVEVGGARETGARVLAQAVARAVGGEA